MAVEFDVIQCPFCGSDSISIRGESRPREGVHVAYVLCQSCLATGPRETERNVERSWKKAQDAWNKRKRS